MIKRMLYMNICWLNCVSLNIKYYKLLLNIKYNNMR